MRQGQSECDSCEVLASTSLGLHSIYSIPIRWRQCRHERLAALGVELTGLVVRHCSQYLLKVFDGGFPMLAR
jgi:hypothetical protein